MTQATHTPGPWATYVDSAHDGWITAADGNLIACAVRDESMQANAALIAAAPDLLSALENLLALTELHIAERSKTPEEEDTFLACHHIVQARAEIAKAKGA